jgi:hypothetical protein
VGVVVETGKESKLKSVDGHVETWSAAQDKETREGGGGGGEWLREELERDDGGGGGGDEQHKKRVVVWHGSGKAVVREGKNALVVMTRE